MKNILIIFGVVLVAVLAMKDTYDRFQEINHISVITPAQQEMRLPAQQNPGQSQSDIQSQRRRNKDSNRHWDNSTSKSTNNIDNYNRNPQRGQSSLRKFFNKKQNGF